MIAWTLQIMLSTTMLMLMVLALRRPVAQLFGAEWAYALWLLPVVVPFLPDLPSFAPEPAFTLLLPTVDAMPSATAAAPAATSSSAGQWLLLLLAFWGGGAAFFAIWQQSTYSAFLLHLGPQGRTAVPPSYGGIKVVESDAVEGPVALGVFNRRIVVPLDFATRYSAIEQRLALEHELIHHRRFDIVWNWVALAVLTFNWFNPIAHFAFRAFRIDQELACDAAVTRRSPSERHDYACALVKSASHPGVVAVCPLNRAEFLKRRLRMMKQHRASWARTIGGAVSILAAGFLGLAFGTPGFAQSEPALSGKLAVSRPSDPIISKSDIARLRQKCGKDEPGGQVSIVCSSEEARDPEVRAIMDRTMRRVDEHVEKVTRQLQDAKIEQRVARAVAAADRMEPVSTAALAARIEQNLRASRMDGSDQRRRIAEAMARAHMVPAPHIDQVAISQALKRANVHLASLDIDRTVREALRSSGTAMSVVRVRLSPEDKAEMEAEMAQARREAQRDAEEARREALEDAAEARREAMREGEEARREALREADRTRREALQQALESQREALRQTQNAQREISRQMRELERQLRSVPTPPPPPPPPPAR